MMLSMKHDKGESSTERVWRENGFFGDQRTDLTIVKANFPENTLVYVNNSSITPVKDGHAMYLDFVILAQVLPVANPPPEINLDPYKFQENEVLICTLLYNTENGLYRGLTKKLGYIILRSDANETFFSYSPDKERSKVLYCVNKQPLPNIFQCTAFKKHVQFLMSQKQENLVFSKMFMFLPSTLDRKEDIQQYSSNVNLHPIDVSYDQLKALNGHEDFSPADLDNSSSRNKITKVFYSFMKEVAAVSSHNLVKNSNATITNDEKVDPDFEFSWVNDSYAQPKQKFQLGYQIIDSKNDFRLTIEDILPGNVWWNILNFSEAHDFISLIYISKHLANLLLIKFDKYYKLSTGFCSFGQWRKKLCDNSFNLLSKLYTDLELFFDFEVYTIKLMKTMRHLSLFSVFFVF